MKHKIVIFSPRIKSFNRRVEISVVATGKLLWEVKGGGQGQAISKAEVTQAADAIWTSHLILLAVLGQ